MTSRDAYQTVVDPDDLSELERAVQEAIAREEALRLPLRVYLRQAIAIALHPLGIHHWVHLRVFDPASRRIVRTNDWTCTLCPAARAG